MTTYQQYLGQITLDSTMIDFSINDGGGADAVQLIAADYYIAGYTGESRAQLVEHMQYQIRQISGYGAATVTYSATTGLITIDFGTTTTVTWTDSALQTLLGFTGTQTGSSSYTATNTPKGVWRPTRGLALYPGDLDQWWLPYSTSKVSVSVDGATYSTQGNEINHGLFEYRHLPKSDVITESATVWSTLQKFWDTVVHAGKPIRAYPDRTATGSTAFKTSLWLPADAEPGGSEAMTIGDFAAYVGRGIERYNGLWDVRFRLVEHNEA